MPSDFLILTFGQDMDIFEFLIKLINRNGSKFNFLFSCFWVVYARKDFYFMIVFIRNRIVFETDQLPACLIMDEYCREYLKGQRSIQNPSNITRYT